MYKVDILHFDKKKIIYFPHKSNMIIDVIKLFLFYICD